MAEIIRIPRRAFTRPAPLGRISPLRVAPPPEVHYDYADADTAEREAERLWNDSDPTVPGTIKVPPEATPPPAAAALTPARRPGWRLRALALAVVATAAAAGLREWGFAQRRATRPALPVTTLAAPPPIIVNAWGTPVAPGSEAGPAARRNVDASAVASGDRRRANAGEGRHRNRRAKAAAPSDVAETMDVELVGRGKRGRLRPIDTADPFAP